MTAIPIHLVTPDSLKTWLKSKSAVTRAWVESNSYKAAPNTFCLLPSESGKLNGVLLGAGASPDMWTLAALIGKVPPGSYSLDGVKDKTDATKLALGWQLGTYAFDRYKKKPAKFPSLETPKSADGIYIKRMRDAVFLARDLINTPANDMGPTQLSAACKDVAKDNKAEFNEIVGDALLKQNYPTIHMVGRASIDKPRLIDIRWGNPKHPKVTLVGKGVCFDSGGLDLKTAAGMKMMKKDMGGAAVILALAKLVMEYKLPVCLRVLIPAVENSVSGNAFRPLDVVTTRKGITVEVGNTDAEGRLILCDALAEADSESPALLIDCATLTGAARTALGTDMPAFFTNDNKLSEALHKFSNENDDPLWRMPLWKPYREMLSSKVADLSNCDDTPYAGAITAALYLKEFVEKTKSWVHIDMMAWNLTNRPGRPAGGEAMALRALFALIRERFTK